MTPIEGHAGAHPVRISQELDTRSPNPDGRLHSKIVEILASTSNGCLTELGYQPGIAEKLHRYMTHIQTLEGENAKLYQDNCQLSSHVQLLNERVAHLSANQGTQLQQFATMQERLRALETERNKLVHQNQEILIRASNGTSHELLSTELERVRAQAARVLQEMTVLKSKYKSLVAGKHGQTSPGGVLSPSDPAPRIIHSQFPILSDIHQRRSSADGVPRLQPVRLPQQQVLQQPQHYLRPMQEQVQYLPPQPRQFQHGQQVQAQRRPSANSYLPQQLIPMTAIRTVPPPMSAPPTFGARSPATSFALPPPMSAPLNPILSHEPLHTLPLTYGPQPAYPIASAPVINKLQPSPLRSPPPLTIDLTELEPRERTAEQPARDGQVDQPTSLKRTSSTVDGALVEDNEVIKRQRTAEPIQTPQDPVGEKPASPDPKPASDATSPGQVGESNDEVPIPPTPSDTVGSNPTSPASAGPSPPTPLAGDKGTVPRGKDDTRSVEDCIFMIYEPDAETADGYFCGRCFDRFEARMLLDAPEVLIRPKLEDLFMHCTKEHPTIWDDLRSKRDLDPEVLCS